MNNVSKRSSEDLYLVGDKVLLKKGLIHNSKYGGMYYSSSMEFAVNEPIEIMEICVEDGLYLLDHGLMASPFMIDHGRSLELNNL